jgi:competence protein ComGA
MEELFDKIFFRALTKQATDIHFILTDHLLIKFRILGELVNYDKLEYKEGERLLNFMKYQASINTNYRLLPQTGRFQKIYKKNTYYLRVSYLPSLDFESIVVRILNNHDPLTIDELMPIHEITSFLKMLPQYNSGLFLISGATGSGKSTTLYTILDEILSLHNKNVVTIEDPIEMRKKDCLQIELNEKLGITYHDTLRQILRHDPDVIMIGEIRDEITAQIAITCALTGHLVLTTIHASNAHLALKRLENLGISKIDLEDVVMGSLSQKIKYDHRHQKVVILAELMQKESIHDYLTNHCLHYSQFKDNAHILIQQGFDNDLFSGELDE